MHDYEGSCGVRLAIPKRLVVMPCSGMSSSLSRFAYYYIQNLW